MVRYTGHFLINYLSDGDLTGLFSVAKLSTWNGGTSHCRDATPHHLRKTILLSLLFCFVFFFEIEPT